MFHNSFHRNTVDTCMCIYRKCSRQFPHSNVMCLCFAMRMVYRCRYFCMDLIRKHFELECMYYLLILSGIHNGSCVVSHPIRVNRHIEHFHGTVNNHMVVNGIGVQWNQRRIYKWNHRLNLSIDHFHMDYLSKNSVEFHTIHPHSRVHIRIKAFDRFQCMYQNYHNNHSNNCLFRFHTFHPKIDPHICTQNLYYWFECNDHCFGTVMMRIHQLDVHNVSLLNV